MIFIALKYMFAKPRQTILTLLGIFFGTGAFIVLSGMMLGFRAYFVEQLINNSAHIRIQGREDFLTDHSLDSSFFGKSVQHIFWNPPPSGRKDRAIIENPHNWYQRLASDPRVTAFTPQLTISMILSNGNASTPATVTGCDPLRQLEVTTIGDYMKEGRFEDLGVGGNRLVIGSELQKRLGIKISQNVIVASAGGLAIPFKVVGIFKTGQLILDSMSFANLMDIQMLNQTPNQVGEIAIKLHDHTQAKRIANAWTLWSSEKIQSWDEISASLFNVFRVQDVIRYISVGSILIVAAFGIYNILNITVMQKRKDIAILRSMGYRTRDIVTLFFLQGLILAVTGMITGLIAGYLVCRYLATVPFGGSPLGEGTGHLTISFASKIYIHAALLAMSSAILASVLPAQAAGKMTPIDIIRSGAE